LEAALCSGQIDGDNDRIAPQKPSDTQSLTFTLTLALALVDEISNRGHVVLAEHHFFPDAATGT
jgi:hypothetical protein